MGREEFYSYVVATIYYIQAKYQYGASILAGWLEMIRDANIE